MHSATKRLFRAVHSSNYAEIKTALKQGGCPNQIFFFGRRRPDGTRWWKTAFIVAVQTGDETVVRLLLAAGALIDMPMDGGYTALMIAATKPSAGMAKLLCQRGATVDRRTQDGNTALHIAVERRRFHTTKLLLLAGADPNLAPCANANPLQTACLRCAGITRLLLRYNAMVWPVGEPMPVVVRAARRPWAPCRHGLFGPRFQRAVRALLAVKLRSALWLPCELWWLVGSFLTRKAFSELDTAGLGYY